MTGNEFYIDIYTIKVSRRSRRRDEVNIHFRSFVSWSLLEDGDKIVLKHGDIVLKLLKICSLEMYA